MIKTISSVISGLAVAGALFVILGYFHPWSPLFPEQEPHRIVLSLGALADSAFRGKDSPIGAIILYGDRVLGTGYNTVVREGNAGGHAEINAISSVLRRYGNERFSRLDRDSLVLVTSFEPCPMCRGAIAQYNIRHVEIVKTRPPADLVREDIKIIRYYWQRRITGPESLQDSLFRQKN